MKQVEVILAAAGITIPGDKAASTTASTIGAPATTSTATGHATAPTAAAAREGPNGLGPGPSVSYGLRVGGGARPAGAGAGEHGAAGAVAGKPLDLRELDALVSKELVASQVGSLLAGIFLTYDSHSVPVH